MAAVANLRVALDSLWLLAVMFSLSGPALAYSQGIFAQKLRVQEESQLDWKYAAERIAAVASEPVENYKPRKQLYDLFGPRQAPSRDLPLILFISPGKVPLEWKQFAPVCQRHGILFAGVRNAGNGQDPAVRIRAAVEVLDDVRRRYRVDPDRTYVAGFSGGAVVASQLAFSLPECFGGLLCIGQRVILPRNETLIDRGRERIHIAALCGGNELVGPEVEHLDHPIAIAHGFRCRSFVSRGKGHRMPKAGVMEMAFNWLDEGVDKRSKVADQYPTTRLDAKRKYDASLWRNSLIDEADSRWKAQEYAGAVRLLKWIEARWPDTSAATQAVADARALEQRSEFIEDQSKEVEMRRSAIDLARVSGYEKLAADRRAWFTKERRAAYAQRALLFIEHSETEITDRAERVEKLRQIAARGKR